MMIMSDEWIEWWEYIMRSYCYNGPELSVECDLPLPVSYLLYHQGHSSSHLMIFFYVQQIKCITIVKEYAFMDINSFTFEINLFYCVNVRIINKQGF